MTPHRRDITLANWRLSPFSEYSFQHVGEFVPSAVISANVQPESPQLGPGPLAKLQVNGVALPNHLATSHADSLCIMRQGQIIAEWNAAYCDPTRPHLIFSISKSITGLLAGILIGQGKLTADDPVIKHVPEVAGSAFADASLRNLLDMQTSLDFAEDYLDPTGAYDRYRRSMLWNPDRADDPVPDMLSFFTTLKKGTNAHGSHHAYQTPAAEMAGIVLERAAGIRLPDLFTDLLWKPMNAHADAFITVDRIGTCRAGGGMSVTTRDLARLGELVRQNGAGIVPEPWINDLWHGGNRAIWGAGDQSDFFPRGSYRSYWYETGEGELCAIGIHGQWLWIDPARETVIALMSSLPLPLDDANDFVILHMLREICRHA